MYARKDAAVTGSTGNEDTPRKKPVRRRRKPTDDGRDEKKNSDWVVNYLLIVSSIVWACNFFFGVFIASYKGSETVNAVFMAVIGGIFTLKTKAKNNEKKDDE